MRIRNADNGGQWEAKKLLRVSVVHLFLRIFKTRRHGDHRVYAAELDFPDKPLEAVLGDDSLFLFSNQRQRGMLCRQFKSKPDARERVAKIDFRIVGILGSHHV